MTEQNFKTVYKSLINNLGHWGMNRIGTVLGLPPMSNGKYNRYAKHIYKRMSAHFNSAMQQRM